jgi:hypothetical protein
MIDFEHEKGASARFVETAPCKHCGQPTKMLGTKQCDGCWQERRSGRMDTLETALREIARYDGFYASAKNPAIRNIRKIALAALGFTNDTAAEPK